MRLDKGPLNLLWGVNVSRPEENMQGAVSIACKKQGALGGPWKWYEWHGGQLHPVEDHLATNILA